MRVDNCACKVVYYPNVILYVKGHGTSSMTKKRSSNCIHAYRVQNELVGTNDIYVVSMSIRSISPGSMPKVVS